MVDVLTLSLGAYSFQSIGHGNDGEYNINFEHDHINFELISIIVVVLLAFEEVGSGLLIE